MKVLLVQPDFPVPNKSLNHKSVLPVGLLKLATLLTRRGASIELASGMQEASGTPDKIYVTSLFTYWAQQVWDTVGFYRELYPSAEITVGGIYASLSPRHAAGSGCDHVHVGIHPEAEQCAPAYDLVETDFQIIHASRGCTRRCSFCGTYRIEPNYTCKESIVGEIVRHHLVFYDNYLLANPHISRLLSELANYRLGRRVVTAECQSGFDGRLLTADLAHLLKAARFRFPRIAWDGPLEDLEAVGAQIQMLEDAGYKAKDISVFMIFNHDLAPEILEAKARQCLAWGVQVADCRNRPLNRYEDGYNSRMRSQEPGEYYLHPGWSDSDVRGFRRMVRQHNICLRYNIPPSRYDQRLEGLSKPERRQLMHQLGIEGDRLSLKELDALNAAWLAELSSPSPDAASIEIAG